MVEKDKPEAYAGLSHSEKEDRFDQIRDVYKEHKSDINATLVPFPARFVDTGNLPLTQDSCLRVNGLTGETNIRYKAYSSGNGTSLPS